MTGYGLCPPSSSRQCAKHCWPPAIGVRTVEYGEKRVTYASEAEMAAALADLDRRLTVLAPGRRRRRILTFADKGL